MELQDFVGLAGIPLVIGLVEVVKGFGLATMWQPVVAIAFGLIINIAIAFSLSTNILLSVLFGLITGLAASGLYSGSKAVAGK
jgi:hypothetical protein